MAGGTPNSAHPKPKRIWIRLPPPLWLGLAAVVATGVAAAVGGDPADDKFDGNATQPERQVKVASPTVLNWVFGPNESHAGAARKQLDTLLRQKIVVVDRMCKLTDAQKEKLQLAGRGDIKRLLDRVEEIEVQFQLVKDDAEKVQALQQEAQLLRRGFTAPGVPRDGLSFVTILDRLLTPEQTAQYRALQAVFRAGGLISTWRRGSEEALGISLNGTAISDDGLVHLSELPRLETLALHDTQVTDAGLAHLAAVTSLQTLALQNTQVTDAGLGQLTGLTRLEFLAIGGTQVTDVGLAHLKELTGLQGLLLGKTKVTDAGLPHLKNLTGLRLLWLNSTQVTDTGLRNLTELIRLERLILNDTRVTDEGVAELQRALPGLKVEK